MMMETIRPRPAAGPARVALATLAVLAVMAITPGIAAAHGPVAPVATSYLAKVRAVPAGFDAKVVDGYVRMWLRVPASQTVVVLDYLHAPYLRFSHAGVQVNHNSAMYYLNQTPVAETPPADLRRTTPPQWQFVSAGHDYEWHDGRLQALASIALSPGARYVGPWSIPLLVDGHAGSISGSLWHAADPSLVWFWPILVLLACVLAAWRVRRPGLDRRVARLLGLAALAGIALASVARGLHGRPAVTVTQLIELVVVLALVGWGLIHVVFRRPGYFAYFVIAFVAIWEGIDLFPTLRHGFVLLALPAFVARSATVVCLAGGAALVLLVFRLAEQRQAKPRRARAAGPGEATPDPLPEISDVG